MVTAIGQKATELSRTNPWWRGGPWAATDVDLRRVEARSLGYHADCLDNLTPGGLYLLRGPRRVGKTVVVKQTIEHLLADGIPPTSIVRVAADGWSAKDLRTVVQNAALPPTPVGAAHWWFLDEVTAVTGEWAQQVKWLRDNDPDFAEATVVLTGSSAGELTEAAGVLAGRRGTITAADRTLLPMGFRTFARLLDPGLPDDVERLPLSGLRGKDPATSYHGLLPWLDTLIRLWERYLAYGGFPVSVSAARDGLSVPADFVNDIFNVVFKDAFSGSRLSTTTTSALVERVMSSMASPLNMSNIAADLGLDAQVVRRHVNYLRDAYLVWQCPQKADKSWTPRERAQDKVYAIDPLVARLAHLRSPERLDVDPTVLTEMLLGMAVQRAAYAAGTAWADDQFLFYERTPTRKEIDFVAQPLAGVALEGKYSDTVRWAGSAATVNASQWAVILATRSVLDTGASTDAGRCPQRSLPIYSTADPCPAARTLDALGCRSCERNPVSTQWLYVTPVSVWP